MPHKHVRRKGDDHSEFNLAPSVKARPLPNFKSTSKVQKTNRKGAKPTNVTTNGYKYDDTPRAFARMVHLQSTKKRQRSGLDDGDARQSKKKRTSADAVSADAARADTVAPEQPAQPALEVPKILPGERLGDFAARVDHALPVTGLARKGKGNIEGMKERQTRTEKRLQKMYASWREDEARLKEKEEERLELEEEDEEERGNSKILDFPVSKRSAKKKRRMIGEQGGADDEDPWAELKAKREERKGLHDVVQAPPSFKAVPKEKFKVREGARVDVADVPTKAGSLKKREELGEARREVIERYRAMMASKK